MILIGGGTSLPLLSVLPKLMLVLWGLSGRVIPAQPQLGRMRGLSDYRGKGSGERAISRVTTSL